MSNEKAEEILRDILKPLYFKIDKKWTDEDNNKISALINELKTICNE